MANIYELMEVEKPYVFTGINTYEGCTVPRVTSILGFIDSEGLIDWANLMGRRGINNKDILEKAAHTGTVAHESIEQFLKEGKEPPVPGKPFQSFMKWYKQQLADGHTIEVLGQEQKLYCEWFVGTYDLLMKYDGKIILVDFKTSNHVHYKYCMQLAAYRYMLRLQGIEIDGVKVLQLNKQKVLCTEFSLDFNVPEKLEYMDLCEKSFMSLAYTYHQISKVKNKYPW